MCFGTIPYLYLPSFLPSWLPTYQLLCYCPLILTLTLTLQSCSYPSLVFLVFLVLLSYCILAFLHSSCCNHRPPCPCAGHPGRGRAAQPAPARGGGGIRRVRRAGEGLQRAVHGARGSVGGGASREGGTRRKRRRGGKRRAPRFVSRREDCSVRSGAGGLGEARQQPPAGWAAAGAAGAGEVDAGREPAVPAQWYARSGEPKADAMSRDESASPPSPPLTSRCVPLSRDAPPERSVTTTTAHTYQGLPRYETTGAPSRC